MQAAHVADTEAKTKSYRGIPVDEETFNKIIQSARQSEGEDLQRLHDNKQSFIAEWITNIVVFFGAALGYIELEKLGILITEITVVCADLGVNMGDAYHSAKLKHRVINNEERRYSEHGRINPEILKAVGIKNLGKTPRFSEVRNEHYWDAFTKQYSPTQNTFEQRLYRASLALTHPFSALSSAISIERTGLRAAANAFYDEVSERLANKGITRQSIIEKARHFLGDENTSPSPALPRLNFNVAKLFKSIAHSDPVQHVHHALPFDEGIAVLRKPEFREAIRAGDAQKAGEQLAEAGRKGLGVIRNVPLGLYSFGNYLVTRIEKNTCITRSQAVQAFMTMQDRRLDAVLRTHNLPPLERAKRPTVLRPPTIDELIDRPFDPNNDDDVEAIIHKKEHFPERFTKGYIKLAFSGGALVASSKFFLDSYEIASKSYESGNIGFGLAMSIVAIAATSIVNSCAENMRLASNGLNDLHEEATKTNMDGEVLFRRTDKLKRRLKTLDNIDNTDIASWYTQAGRVLEIADKIKPRHLSVSLRDRVQEIREIIEHPHGDHQPFEIANDEATPS